MGLDADVLSIFSNNWLDLDTRDFYGSGLEMVILGGCCAMGARSSLPCIESLCDRLSDSTPAGNF